MFWKESLFISVLFYYYDFLSGVFLFCFFSFRSFQIIGFICVLFFPVWFFFGSVHLTSSVFVWRGQPWPGLVSLLAGSAGDEKGVTLPG